jgi:hypothetical protein
MKTPFLTLLILGAAITTAQAQVTQEWVARHASATPYNDVPYAMTVGDDGHVYVTGTTATTGSNDWTTIKYDAAGRPVWLRTLDGGGADAALAIVTDDAGNVYVTGSSGGGFYSMTAKYSAAGDQLWVQSFTTIGEGDAGTDIAVDHDGNAYVTGYNVESATGLDIVTIKYGAGGAELWVRRYDAGNGEDVPAAIACDASGVYVTGRSGGDIATIKYDFDGDEQWVRTYDGGFGSDAPAALVLDASGHLYVAGQSAGDGTNTDFVTIKYDAAGARQWVRRYDGPATVPARDYDRAAALAVDASGNVLVTGNSADDFATVKYDAAGAEVWVRRYDGPSAGADWATAIAVDASGNAYVSGSSHGTATTQYDFATLSYDATGAVRWTERYDGSANFYDTPYAIAVDASGDVYVTGSSGGSGSGLDYATIKYAQPTTAVVPGPRGVFALRNDPNPFTPATRIRFTIPPGAGREQVRLAVYDVRGAEVALLVNEALAPGTYERELNGSTLGPGIYWSRLHVGERSQTRKMIRVK